MSERPKPSGNGKRPPANEEGRKPIAPFAEPIGHTRFVVLLGVFAVLVVSVALFLLGAVMAVSSVWSAFGAALRGEIGSTDLTVQFLEIVSVMLKAVVFYLVGIGFYSLFIAPLNLPATLGVETLHDLESKIVSVIIVIMSVTFLEHFIQWREPLEIVQFGGVMALVIAALVLFQLHGQRAKREETKHTPAIEERAQSQLFKRGEEQRDIDDERPAVGRGQDHRR
jgi:uncharacterized membrane protein YqhA